MNPIYFACYCLINLFAHTFFSLRFIGTENIPRKGSFIIASNHRSNIDPFIVGLMKFRTICYMAKDSLFKNPVLAFLFYAVGAFPVKRGSRDFRAVRETIRRLERGYPVVIFPEGTRQKESGVKKNVHAGIGLIAQKANVPVLPVFVKGSDVVMPPGSKWFNQGHISIYIGKVLTFDQGEDYPVIANKIMEEIDKLGQMANKP